MNLANVAATHVQQEAATRAQVDDRVDPAPLRQPEGGCTHCANLSHWAERCRCDLPCGFATCPAASLDHLYSYLAIPVPVLDPTIRVQPRVWPSRYDDPDAPTGAVRPPLAGLDFDNTLGRYVPHGA